MVVVGQWPKRRQVMYAYWKWHIFDPPTKPKPLTDLCEIWHGLPFARSIFTWQLWRQLNYVSSAVWPTKAGIKKILKKHRQNITWTHRWACVHKKVKEVDLYSAFIEVSYTQGAQVRITQCYLQITQYLPLPRKHSPDGASQTEVADI